MKNQVHTCLKGIIAERCVAVADRRVTKQLLCLAALALAAMLILVPSAGAQGDQYDHVTPQVQVQVQPGVGGGGPGDPFGVKAGKPPPYEAPKPGDGSAAQEPSMNGKDTLTQEPSGPGKGTPTQESSKTSKDISSSQTSSKVGADPSSQKLSPSQTSSKVGADSSSQKPFAIEDDASVREAPKAGGDSAAQEPSTGVLQTLSSIRPYLQGGLPLVAAGSLSGWFWFIWWFFL